MQEIIYRKCLQVIHEKIRALKEGKFKDNCIMRLCNWANDGTLGKAEGSSF